MYAASPSKCGKQCSDRGGGGGGGGVADIGLSIYVHAYCN